jgi:hypothetical protein
VFGAVLLMSVTYSALADAQVNWTVNQDARHDDHHLDLVFGSGGAREFGFAPGILYGFPLLPRGFIPELNDSFELEVGLHLHTWFGANDTYLWMTPVGGARYNVWLTRTVDAFFTMKLGWAIGFDSAYSGGIYGFGGVGMDWFFVPSAAVRVELGGGRGGGSAQVGLRFNL